MEWIDQIDSRLSRLREEEALVYYRADKQGKLDASALKRISRARQLLLLDPKVAERLHRPRARRCERITARRTRLLELAVRMARIDDDPALSALRHELEQAQYAHKPCIEGKPVELATVGRILTCSDDARLRREAHLSILTHLQSTERLARESIRRANGLARQQGFRDYARAKLAYEELSMSGIRGVLASTVSRYTPLMRSLLKGIRGRLRTTQICLSDIRYGINSLAPCAPEAFPAKELLPSLRKTIRAFGQELRHLPILVEFMKLPYVGACHPLKVGQDIRVAVNHPSDGFARYATLFHEFGHAIYYTHAPAESALLLDNRIGREGLAEVWAGFIERPEWLAQHTRLSRRQVHEFLKWQEMSRAYSLLTYVAETHFELALYRNPDADFVNLWKAVTSQYLGVEDATGVYSDFVFLYPLDIKDYIYAHVIREAVIRRLARRCPGGVESPAALNTMIREYYAGGNAAPWHKRLPLAANP